MNISRRLLTLVSILATTAGLHAQTVTPNPAPTIITSAPYTITKPGFYQLGADLTVTTTGGNIITISSGNVTLDFAGHYISGPVDANNTVYGVYAYEKGNINIQNGTIAYCYTGIELAGSGSLNSLNINQRINNMLVTYCYHSGITLSNANYSQYNNNRISFVSSGQSSVYGIYDQSSSGNQAVNNTITEVTTSASTAEAYGIYALYNTLAATNNTVSNVTQTYSGDSASAYGIFNAAFAIGNTVRNCYYGISFGKYENNLTSGCTMPFDGGTNVGGNN